jgi:penicillin-binding protein 1C
MIKSLLKKTGLKHILIIITALYSICVLIDFSFIINPYNRVKFRSSYKGSYRFYDRNGVLIRECVNENGDRAIWIDMENISTHVIDAFIAAEDKRFYSHSGIDYIAAGRAVIQNIMGVSVKSGASTIDMQLARIVNRHPRNLFGKILQLYDTVKLEKYLDKQTILLNYLNRTSYGGGIIGIETASIYYFNKHCINLNIAESAFLAGLPNSPFLYNPVTNFKEAKKRQEFVLKRMRDTNKISGLEYKNALDQNVIITGSNVKPEAIHFTDYVMSFKPGSGNIKTTLDLEMNNQIESMIRDHVSFLKTGGLTNASCIVLDNESGDILAMVGSSDYWNKDAGSVNGSFVKRQPGSTLKPFTYALAFEKGFTPLTVVPDVKTDYTGPDKKRYIPKNYSDRYYGPVLLREALGRSLNVTAVRLANAVGIDLLLETYRKAGLVSLDRSYEYYGLGLTLGDGEVTLLELAQSYALFARDGISCRSRCLLKDEIFKGQRVFSSEVCFLITDILSDENLRIQAFGMNNPLILGFPISIKTGTSSNWRDNWVIGYTKKHTIAVWAGDFEGQPMNQLSGVIGAGPLFNKIARFVSTYQSKQDISFYDNVPPGIEKIAVCTISGLTPTKYCPNTISSFVLSEDVPRKNCDVHRMVRLDNRNGLLASDKCPKQFIIEKVFTYLPPVYAEWQSMSEMTLPPVKYSPLSPLNGIVIGALVITQPKNGDVYIYEPGYNKKTQSIKLTGEIGLQIQHITWFIDGIKFADSAWPYSVSWPLMKGKHKVQMVNGSYKSEVVSFEVR